MNTTKISMVSTILMTPQFLIMPKKKKKTVISFLLVNLGATLTRGL